MRKEKRVDKEKQAFEDFIDDLIDHYWEEDGMCRADLYEIANRVAQRKNAEIDRLNAEMKRKDRAVG